MRYVRCQIHHLEARCRERGYAIGPALACISQSGDGFIIVDTEHSCFPRGIRPAHTLPWTDVSRTVANAGCGCSPPKP
jgi:hypothetical protein